MREDAGFFFPGARSTAQGVLKASKCSLPLLSASLQPPISDFVGCLSAHGSFENVTGQSVRDLLQSPETS